MTRPDPAKYRPYDQSSQNKPAGFHGRTRMAPVTAIFTAEQVARSSIQRFICQYLIQPRIHLNMALILLYVPMVDFNRRQFYVNLALLDCVGYF